MSSTPESAGAAVPRPEIMELGDAALLVVFGSRIDERLNAAAHALAEVIRTVRAGGRPWGAPVPSYASVVLPYDVRAWDADRARAELSTLLDGVDLVPGRAAARSPVIEVPVSYGGVDGPDLDEVAQRCGVRRQDVIDLHSSVDYRAYVLGFLPGFAYLGTLPERLHLPRRRTPRTRVPAGSVAIAGQQTAVYPGSTPGGWHLIGRTELAIWDASRDRPALIEPGARVRFVPR